MYNVSQNSSDIVKMNPGYLESLKKRAIRREVMNDLTRSLEDISAACMLEEFKNDDTLIAADRISKKLGKIHAKEAMVDREAFMPSKHFIRTYFSSFAEDVIINNLEKQIKLTDRDFQGFAQAQYSFMKHKYDEIIPACCEEIECNGEDTSNALMLRGTFYLLMGDHQKALLDYDNVISDEISDVKLRVNALIKRAAIRMHLQTHDGSFEDFEQAIALDPTNSDIYYHRGQLFLHMQNMKKALEDYEKSLSLNPNFPYAHMQKCYTDYRLANIIQDPEKMQDVFKSFEQGIKKFPDSAEFFSLYGQVLCDKGEYEKADTYFTAALELEPDNSTVHVHRGLLQLEWKEDTNKAMEHISEALKIDQRCEFAYETLGTIEVQRGNLESAVDLFDKAISLARSESELEHLFSLRDVAIAQARASEKLDILLVSDAED